MVAPHVKRRRKAEAAKKAAEAAAKREEAAAKPAPAPAPKAEPVPVAPKAEPVPAAPKAAPVGIKAHVDEAVAAAATKPAPKKTVAKK